MYDLQEAPEWPTKCISTTTTLAINASVRYIDFEGRSDGESVQKIIESMKPKRTIVVRGTPDHCQALYNLSLSVGNFRFDGSIFFLKNENCI